MFSFAPLFKFATICATLVLSIGAQASPQSNPSEILVYLKCLGPDGVESTGSGIIFTEEGHVLTARHVAGEDSTCKGLIGRADAEPDRILDRRETTTKLDFAILQFRKNHDDKFRDITIARTIQQFDQLPVEAFGFPSFGGTLTRRTGDVSSVNKDSMGLFDIGTNTAQGMSGGPVFSKGKLIGIVARADFDTIGQVWRYAALASDMFYDAVSKVRDNNVLDAKESALASLRDDLNGDEACSQLLRQAIMRRYPDAVPGLSLDKFNPPTNMLADLENGGAEYWVTINTGAAKWINCSEGTPERMHYFPMGLLLRPMQDLTLRDPKFGTREWTIFQAEYGLLVLIPREAVAPVTPDVGYVFPEGTFVHKLCGPLDGDDCNPGENLPPLNNNQARWPTLAPWESYLRSTDVAGLEKLQAHHAAYVENRSIIDAYLEASGSVPFGVHQREPKSLEDDPACIPHQAHLFKYGKIFDPDAKHENSEYELPVLYSLCNDPPPESSIKFATPRPVKIVTHSLAEKKFSGLWSSSIEFQLTETGRKARDVLQDTPRLPVSRLDCEQDLTPFISPVKTAEETGQGIGDIISETRRVLLIEPGFSYHFKLYRPGKGRSTSQKFREVPLFQDVELKVYCGDDRRPKRAREVRIHLYPLFPEPISLNFEDVENWYLNNYNNWGFENRRHLSNGYLERICDYPEYYQWRATLERFLVRDADIISASESSLGVEKSVTASHFAHLVLAMLFFTEVELKTKTNYGVCKT